jgi:hypothetical protein
MVCVYWVEQVIEKLSVRAPSGEIKLKLLKEIAAEHNVDWDPADTEAELMKQPEDLLVSFSFWLSIVFAVSWTLL